MNNDQKEILIELKKYSQKIGHSPTRREIPSLAKKCYKYFNSFNRAKELVGLEIKNKQIISFPKRAFEVDNVLVTIIAYLTADGHLYKDMKGFYFSSKDKDFLEYLSKIVHRKFGLNGKYVKGNGHGKSYKYLVFNKIVTLFLNNNGAPPGDKVLTPFDVPKWIKNNLEFVRQYLKIIFYCEGSRYKQSKNTQVIKINFNKAENLLNDGANFMNSLKEMLNKFDVETTNSWITKGNERKKDNNITKTIVFHIKSNSVNKFINNIGWLK